MLILKKYRETGLHASLAQKKSSLVYFCLFQVLGEVDESGPRYIMNGAAAYFDVLYAAVRRELIFTLEPSLVSYFAATVGGLRYLCWSVPQSRMRYLLWLIFVNLCRTIIVNDSITQKEVRRVLIFGKGRVHNISFGVDADFFGLREKSDGYVLVPGDAFRDDEYLEDLIERTNYKFCRLTRREDVSARWEYLKRKYPDRIRLEYRIPHSRLPDVYKGASVTLLPISKKNEPAGLTCLLQSLASGVPVVTDSEKTGCDYINEFSLGQITESKLEMESAINTYYHSEALNVGAFERARARYSWTNLKNDWIRCVRA